jgi:PIN domain nuclease of toxin-antitoxin system
MRLLLDTHALLWFLNGDTALSGTARAAIENGSHEKLVSHASGWEVAIKANLGKITLQIDYDALFPDAVVANGFTILTPRFEHYRALMVLPWYHRDPFDRLLIAQAQTESLTLISKDPHFSSYGISTLW